MPCHAHLVATYYWNLFSPSCHGHVAIVVLHAANFRSRFLQLMPHDVMTCHVLMHFTDLLRWLRVTICFRTPPLPADRLAANVTKEVLEEVRQVKQVMGRLTGRVQRVKTELEVRLGGEL